MALNEVLKPNLKLDSRDHQLNFEIVPIPIKLLQCFPHFVFDPYYKPLFPEIFKSYKQIITLSINFTVII